MTEGTNVQTRSPRRRRIVDGRLQYRVIAVFLTVIVAGLLLFTALAALLSLLAGAADAGLNFLRQVLPWLLLNDVVIMLLVIVVGISATHRIAGPIFRIESDIDRVLNGERGVSVRLRRTDAFPELARKVNQLIEHAERSHRD